MSAFVAAARRYLGVRWLHQGRNRQHGLDCAGLIVAAMDDLRKPVVDLPAYGREPWRDGLRRAVEATFGPPLAREPQPGDVLLMRFATEPQHLAIVGDYVHGGLSLIHSYADVRKVVEHRLDDAWRARIVAVYAGGDEA